MRWSLRSNSEFVQLARGSAKGFRVGFNRRGTYVSFQASGFQYRRQIHDRPPAERTQSSASGFIQTASAEELAKATPEWVVEDSQQRLRKWNLFKAYLWFSAITFLVLLPSGGAALVFGVLAVAAAPFVHRWNDGRKINRLFYDVDDDEIVRRLSMANDAARSLSGCNTLWHIFYAAATSDWKKNAGAGTLIQRTRTQCGVGALPHFELNIETWCVPVGPQQVLFLPDRLLVWDGKDLAAIPYDKLVAQASRQRFIEDGSKPPSDGRQIDTTWRYVRRDGGPDMRFNNNAQLPVMEYGELELTTSSGMRIVLQTSTLAAAEDAARALNALSDVARRGVPERSDRSVTAMPLPKAEPVRAKAEPVVDTPDPAASFAAHVATLLRYLAGADRRLDLSEIGFAKETLGALLPQTHPEHARLTNSFATLPTDPASVQSALDGLSRASVDARRWAVTALQNLTVADGKATPKERERLAELERALMAEPGWKQLG